MKNRPAQLTIQTTAQAFPQDGIELWNVEVLLAYFPFHPTERGKDNVVEGFKLLQQEHPELKLVCASIPAKAPAVFSNIPFITMTAMSA